MHVSLFFGGLVLCSFVNARIESGPIRTAEKNWEGRDGNEELDDWRSLLFPNGNNPLERVVDSSSSTSEEENVKPTSVFQAKFPNKQGQQFSSSSRHSHLNRVNRETAEFFANELSSIVKTEWQGRKINNFDTKVLQLNLSLYNMKIAHIEIPTIRFERLASNVIHLIGSGGLAYVRGNYRSIYKTTRRGQVEAFVYGFNIDLMLKFWRSQSRKILHLDEMECKPTIARIDVKLTPFLLEEVQITVENYLWLLLQQEICARAEEYVQRTDEKFQQSGLETPFEKSEQS